MIYHFLRLLISLTGTVLFGSIWIAYRYFRDPFHPIVYLSLLASSLYVLLPYQLITQKPELLIRYLSLPQLEFAQIFYLLGSTALILGCLIASGRYPWDYYTSVLDFNIDKGIRRLAYFFRSA